MRLVIVQYSGDYREAVNNFAEGRSETYYAQKSSVEAIAKMATHVEEVAVICCLTAEPYNQVLQTGVRAIGAGFKSKIEVKKLIQLIAQQNPTHLVLRTPIKEVLSWVCKKKIKTLAVFAESVLTKGWRSKLQNYWLAILLNHKQIDWLGSYGLTSSLLFKQIGVNPDKIIPWDFLGAESPSFFSPKTLDLPGKTFQLFYIGSLSESKGVGDILEAVAKLKKQSFFVKLKIVGKDENNVFQTKAKELNIEDNVDFVGIVPNNTVVSLMREADVVLVPSRPEYPEGFPLTIFHAICSRTPIIASNHPMFRNDLKHGVSAMIFPAGDSKALSTCIEKLLSDSELYHNLSVASYDVWKRLQIPVKWAELVNRWLHDSPINQKWLFDHRLCSGIYDDRI